VSKADLIVYVWKDVATSSQTFVSSRQLLCTWTPTWSQHERGVFCFSKTNDVSKLHTILFCYLYISAHCVIENLKYLIHFTVSRMHHPDTKADASPAEKARAVERSKLISQAYQQIKSRLK